MTNSAYTETPKMPFCTLFWADRLSSELRNFTSHRSRTLYSQILNKESICLYATTDYLNFPQGTTKAENRH